MNVKVINIQQKYEVLLGFLYPEYSINTSGASVSKFIVHRDINSKREREALDLIYSNCIFISNRIFDEVWDENKIIDEAIKFSRTTFRNRKTKIDYTQDTFVDDIKNFIFQTSSDEFESSINELFESFGSVSFVSNFIKLSESVPLQVLSQSMNTFITRILNPGNSIFYKKKNAILADKIRSNLIKSLDSYNLRSNDSYGLSMAKFLIDLYA